MNNLIVILIYLTELQLNYSWQKSLISILILL